MAMPRKPSDKLPNNSAELEGITKAAILLLALGPERASKILNKTPSTKAVEEVTRELASLGRVPKELQAQVVEEFYGVSIATRTRGALNTPSSC